MKKMLFFAATALVALGSCTSDEFVGENNPNGQKDNGAIVFSSGTMNITRTEKGGADAAAALNNAFVVEGTKGDNSVTTTVVFDNYNVAYRANTANTTESNTNNWEYVGLNVNSLATIPHESTDKQTIKYWDYSKNQYDFIAYSLGAGDGTTTATATAITPGTATVYTGSGDGPFGAYTIKGTTAQLKTVHIADLVTIKSDHYGEPVEIKFRSLGSKVRMGIYETIPGYSVKDVKFYADGETSTTSSNANAILYASSSTLPSSGTYTVYFPTVNKSSGDEGYSDNNKAHVSFVAASSGGTQTYQTFGALTSNYTTAEKHETAGSHYLGRTSSGCTYAGTTTPFYQDVLPYETGTSLTLKVDYTLVSTDGTQETINVTGATAVVPSIYTQWKPGYAYTYIFKISDNTNGKTNPDKTAVGLHPITFDAVAIDTEDGVQETVTTVATPSITTYQHDPATNASANDEYKAGDIYVMVMSDGTPKEDLNGSSEPTKDAAKLYTLSNKTATEAEVMDALNMNNQSSTTFTSPITGRNSLVLTDATTASLDNTITSIPGADGNNITVTKGQASKFTATAGMTYAYVYTNKQSTTNTPKYEKIDTSEFVVGTTDVSSYYTYSESGGTGTYAQATGTYISGTIYYAQYYENDGEYAVKVIKVAPASGSGD